MHLVLLEGLRRPALGLQRPHQHDPAGLPQRVLDHERLQQRDGLARAAGPEQRRSAPLDGHPSQLLEPDRLDPGEVGVGEPGVGPAPPQSQGAVQGVRGLGRRQVPGLLDQGLEHLAVELTRVQVEDVSGVTGDQHATTDDPRQVRAQLEHGAVEGRGRVVRRDLSPDQVHQPVDGHDLARAGGERSQQCRLPTTGQREPGAVGCRERHLTQHPDQHGSSGDQATEEAEAPHGSGRPARTARRTARSSTAARSTSAGSGRHKLASPSRTPYESCSTRP